MTMHQTVHEIDIDAPAVDVYRIVADAEAWPHTLAPTVHVERTDLGDGVEELQLWAVANDAVKGWTSRRELDAEALAVTFRQRLSAPPVASMSGTWLIEAITATTSKLRLLHEFSAIDDDPAGIEWISRATDHNSTVELANLKAVAESARARADVTFSFADSVVIEGSLAAAYDFLYEAKLWGERLPHVGRIDLVEDMPNVQAMSMQTVTKDGSTHVTESVRICFPLQKIAYKQTKTPSMMDAHTGVWTFEELAGGGVKVTSEHVVVVNEAAIATVLGAGKGIEDAKSFIRNAAGGNSLATLTLAKKFVEGASTTS